MDNKLIYIQAINFMKIFYTWGGKWSSKKKGKIGRIQKNGVTIISELPWSLNFIYVESKYESHY